MGNRLMRVRWGRGRRPDPNRAGTVYRAGPGITLGKPEDSRRTAAHGARVSAPSRPVNEEEFWAAQPAPGTSSRSARAERPFSPPPKKRRKFRWWAWLLVLLLVVYPVSLGVLAWSSMHRITAFPSGDRPADTPGTTFLVVGSDSRADLSREERARLGTGQSTGVLTDTIMVLHVKTGSPTVLMSIPRDSYVSIPGHGKGKINAAFSKGGAPLLVQTVEESTGLHIDRFVMTGLGQFAAVVDAIGGIKVCPKSAIKDAKAHLDIPAGCQVVDGKTALGYSRARYSDANGDLGRVKRQREVISAIATKTLSPSVLLAPWRAFPAAAAGGNALTVDNGMMPWHLARFVMGMRKVTGSDGVSLTVPIARSIDTPSGSSLEWDSSAAQKLFTAIANNDGAALKQIAADQARG